VSEHSYLIEIIGKNYCTLFKNIYTFFVLFEMLVFDKKTHFVDFNRILLDVPIMYTRIQG